jgi:Carboxylesterase family
MTDAAIVETDSGPVRGTVTDQYRLFHGVPYAASTAGELRWRSPQPVPEWTKPKDATKPGSMCPQQPSSYADVASLEEDCLLIEGEQLDDRSVLGRRTVIAERYVEAAKSDPWTPPCSFCGESPTIAWFEGPHFRISVNAADEVRADKAWTAFARCFELVQADDREELVRRGMRRLEDRAEPERVQAMTRRLQDKFWVARSTG